ncbi:MAG: DUF559 domain-containing protein [Solirubrobacteraceae bacterium]
MSICGSRDERIAAVAARQRGRIARRQLSAIAVGSASVAWLVGKGRLFPTLRGVFVVGHHAPIELSAETEALLSVRDGAALSHWSAAALWGLSAPPPQEIDVIVSDGAPASNPGVRVHRSRILEARDVRIRAELPVTSPARTLLDIAPLSTERQLELAFDRGIVERVLRPDHIADVLARAGGHRGRARLARLLDRQLSGTSMTRSEAEERVLEMIRAARLPEPRLNTRVAGYELDFFWPDRRFALEVDGFRFHSGRGAFERDRRKDQDLRRVHIDVMRVTWRQIEMEPYAVVAALAEALAL